MKRNAYPSYHRPQENTTTTFENISYIFSDAVDEDDDNDGLLDTDDDDDDGDGIPDDEEDYDGDGLTNENDDDDDGDGVLDGDEDDDGDGLENDEDPDDDGDGVLDENDELQISICERLRLIVCLFVGLFVLSLFKYPLPCCCRYMYYIVDGLCRFSVCVDHRFLKNVSIP